VGKVAYPGPAKLAPEWVAWVHKSQVVAGAVFAVCVLVLLYAAHASEQAQTT
jgi:hypothetical protein